MSFENVWFWIPIGCLVIVIFLILLFIIRYLRLLKKIEERIIINLMEKKCRDAIYDCLAIVVNFLALKSKEEGKLASEIGEKILDLYHFRTLINNDGVIKNPGYELLLQALKKEPEKKEAIDNLHRVIRKIYACDFYGCDKPYDYINAINELLSNDLDECKEELLRLLK